MEAYKIITLPVHVCLSVYVTPISVYKAEVLSTQCHCLVPIMKKVKCSLWSKYTTAYSHYIQIGNRCFENVAQFRYL
jgi:hypothetical protein